MRRSLALLLILSLLPGCEKAGFAIANLPSAFANGGVTTGVAYGPQPWQKLDIYVPPSPGNRQLDTIVFFYGGRWTTGSREDYRFVGQMFADKGFITVIPDYSKYPAVRFPAFVEDGARALAWVHDHISGYHGDPRKIHVAGHSAGAHIGALLSADPHYLAAYHKSTQEVIASFAGLAGPYDFVPDEPDLVDMFGPPVRFPKMQVPTFITGHEPPMLLLWGAEDTTVRRYNLDKLQSAIESKSGQVRTIIYPGTDHVNIVAALSWLNPARAPVADDMVRFFKDVDRHR
ncbi:MAG: alpha/beta hydrolase [Gammaproteobacteria bacterium]